MNVVIEFFDAEMLENAYSCLRYKFDKVYYVGEHDKMTRKDKDTYKKRLKEYCGIKDVVFHEVDEAGRIDYNHIVERIAALVEKEKVSLKNNCYIDITGGQDLVLAAMGAVAERYDLPMFQYDVVTGEELCTKEAEGPKGVVPEQNKKLSIEEYLNMIGSAVNYNKQKEIKSQLANPEFRRDIRHIYEVSISRPDIWNKVSYVIKGLKDYTHGTVVNVQDTILEEKLKNSSIEKRTLTSYMTMLERRGIVTSYVADESPVTTIKFKSSRLLEIIKDAGAALELETYYSRLESGNYDDVRIGTYIDWDGIIHKSDDVENEVDVITIKDNIISFISCKNHGIDKPELYEIDAVASHFGAKYIKKELVTTFELSSVCEERAKEMGIELTVVREEEDD